ncbi:MAG: alpha/beta hydrolase [Candidatus Bathyarchaeota archaeon]|nr:alpha/beta hydrolase [Candidatus Bathyarchaeota archaeon]
MNNHKFIILFITIFILILTNLAIAKDNFIDIETFKNIPYRNINGSDSKLNCLDIYKPLMGNKNHPVLVFVHGGYWIQGDKGNLDDKAKAFTKAGWFLVNINYRLSPEVMHPVHAQDVAKAITWIYENISYYGGNPQNIFLLGHSAGGHLTALIALDEHYLKDLGFSNKIIRGIIGLDCAAYHLPTKIESETENYYLFEMTFGNNPDVWEKASPINYVEKGKSIPPFLLIYAGDWEISKIVNLAFAKALKMANYEIELYYAPEKDHVSIERDLGKLGDNTIEKIFQFIHKYKNNK